MRIVLGSRSPRRCDLLRPLLPSGRFLVRPPESADEQGFEGLHDREQIQQRLMSVVRAKMTAVQRQVRAEFGAADTVCCITADTIVVARDADARTVVLGQPDPQNWPDNVRCWLQWYSGTTHEVWTGFQVRCEDRFVEDVVRTVVRFRRLSPELIETYLRTDESRGKAGGYGIQGTAAMFVDGIDGSLTSVIGLPVAEVMQALRTLGVPILPSDGES